MRSIDRFTPEIVYGHYVEGVIYDRDAVRIPAIRKEFHSANVLQVTAATNGYCGGDSGHGSRTIVRFVDLAGTDIKICPVKGEFSNGGVEIHLGGDCELSTMIEGLRFAADALEKLARGDAESVFSVGTTEDPEPAGNNE